MKSGPELMVEAGVQQAQPGRGCGSARTRPSRQPGCRRSKGERTAGICLCVADTVVPGPAAEGCRSTIPIPAGDRQRPLRVFPITMADFADKGLIRNLLKLL